MKFRGVFFGAVPGVLRGRSHGSEHGQRYVNRHWRRDAARPPGLLRREQRHGTWHGPCRALVGPCTADRERHADSHRSKLLAQERIPRPRVAQAAKDLALGTTLTDTCRSVLCRKANLAKPDEAVNDPDPRKEPTHLGNIIKLPYG